MANSLRLYKFVCLFVCLFVGIKPELLYFVSCVLREVITPRNHDGCTRNQAQTTCVTLCLFVCLFLCIPKLLYLAPCFWREVTVITPGNGCTRTQAQTTYVNKRQWHKPRTYQWMANPLQVDCWLASLDLCKPYTKRILNHWLDSRKPYTKRILNHCCN